MNWLKDNAYLAAWLSPLIALVGMIMPNPRTAASSPDWSELPGDGAVFSTAATEPP